MLNIILQLKWKKYFSAAESIGKYKKNSETEMKNDRNTGHIYIYFPLDIILYKRHRESRPQNDDCPYKFK